MVASTPFLRRPDQGESRLERGIRRSTLHHGPIGRLVDRGDGVVLGLPFDQAFEVLLGRPRPTPPEGHDQRPEQPQCRSQLHFARLGHPGPIRRGIESQTQNNRPEGPALAGKRDRAMRKVPLGDPCLEPHLEAQDHESAFEGRADAWRSGRGLTKCQHATVAGQRDDGHHADGIGGLSKRMIARNKGQYGRSAVR